MTDQKSRAELVAENKRLRSELAGGESLGRGNEKDREEGSAAEVNSTPQETEGLFRAIFHLSPVGISIARLSDDRVIDANQAFCRLTGYDRGELIGDPSVELWADPGRRERIVQRVKEDGMVQEGELQLLTKRGNVRDVRGKFQSARIDGEQRMVSILTDVTESKEFEEALHASRKRAEEVARFRTSVITNMTHEVRTPLTVILGFTSVLREGVEEKYQRFVDLIERSGRRLLLTLDSVLDLAQLEAETLEVSLEPCNILDVVDSVAGEVGPLARQKGLNFTVDMPRESLRTRVDHELLARALKHLLDNAVKFTDEGGITIGVRQEDTSVYIDVTDTGIGIEEEFLSRIFDSFSQESSGIERDYQGTGLGLAVACRLVERIGGTIQVKSEKGAGSTFTVVLPYVGEEKGENLVRGASAEGLQLRD